MGRQSTAIVDVLPGICPSIVLTDIPFQGRTLRFIEPYFLTPYVDSEHPILRVDIPELRIFAWGETLDELVYDLTDEFHISWILYVLKPDAELRPAELTLKRNLQALLMEIEDAAPDTKS